MSIPETISFDKDGEALPGGWLGKGRDLVRKLFLSLVILLVAGFSFGVGRLTSGGAGEPVRIEYDTSLTNNLRPTTNNSQTTHAAQALPTQGGSGVVASKSGTKYHYSSCSGAKQIKVENKITFASAQAAQAAGYTLAANCKAP